MGSLIDQQSEETLVTNSEMGPWWPIVRGGIMSSSCGKPQWPTVRGILHDHDHVVVEFIFVY